MHKLQVENNDQYSLVVLYVRGAGSGKRGVEFILHTAYSVCSVCLYVFLVTMRPKISHKDTDVRNGSKTYVLYTSFLVDLIKSMMI